MRCSRSRCAPCAPCPLCRAASRDHAARGGGADAMRLQWCHMVAAQAYRPLQVAAWARRTHLHQVATVSASRRRTAARRRLFVHHLRRCASGAQTASLRAVSQDVDGQIAHALPLDLAQLLRHLPQDGVRQSLALAALTAAHAATKLSSKHVWEKAPQCCFARHL